MARLKKGAVPTRRHHKPSGQAVVELSGQVFYCGTWGTKVALGEYDRHVAEWLACGRRPLVQDEGPAELTLVELAAAYKRFAKGYYRKNGKTTNEYTTVVRAVQIVCGMYGRQPANNFGPLRLQAVQQRMIQLGWCRR
jgi:hypothetical protein